MFKLITAVVLALTTFTAEAATENFTLGSKQACELAVKALFIDGAKDGWQRVDKGDESYFVKEGYVAFFTKYEENSCVLTSKLISELPAPQTQVERKEVGFWDSGWGTAIKVIALGAIMYKLSAPLAGSGICDFDWQIAKDGSRCGKRSAASRPGGK